MLHFYSFKNLLLMIRFFALKHSAYVAIRRLGFDN